MLRAWLIDAAYSTPHFKVAARGSKFAGGPGSVFRCIFALAATAPPADLAKGHMTGD
jgi:hypothetical protein